MGMSVSYGSPPSEDEMITLIHHAVSKGITFLDTSDVYGPHTNEMLLGKALKGIRDKVQLATKFGATLENGKIGTRGDPAYVRACCEGSLKRLGVEYIDLYFLHRLDAKVPIEVTIGEMKKLVEEGKVKYIGLSEASSSTIRRAHAMHPITAVQVEWSLWTRDIEEEIVPTCKELGIGFVPYSPLGRGFLSSGAKIMESLGDKDYRKSLPRLQGENLEKNKAIFEKLLEFSSRKQCTPGQLALAWLQHQGNDIAPIPGTTKVKNLEENIGAFFVKLTPEEIKEIEDIISLNGVHGDRYGVDDMNITWMKSETPPLSSWKVT